MLSLFILLQLAEALRGVAPELEDKYKPDADGNFHCLGSDEVIPFAKVNDNFCDCADGSDEPGTSACENGLFYCQNEGFKPGYIPSSWVDDGVCDYERCCDGSDEQPGRCENRCKELAEISESKRKLNNEIVTEGMSIRARIVGKSQGERFDTEQELEMLEKKEVEVSDKLADLQKQREERGSESQKEVAEAFKPVDEELSSVVEQADGVKKEASVYKARAESLSTILSKLNNDYNHNFNDPAVKDAAHAFEQYEANIDSVTDTSLSTEELVKKLDEAKRTIMDSLAQSAAEVSEASNFKWYMPFDLRDVVESYLAVRPQDRHKKSKRKSLTALDADIEEAEAILDVAKTEIKKRRESLAQDYGPDDILRSRSDCISNKIAGYNYQLCFTDELTQIDKNDRPTVVGKYELASYDPNTNQLVIEYKGGEKCWNGPNRQAEVRFSCGIEEQIIGVSEPEKCHYLVDAISPMACLQNQLL